MNKTIEITNRIAPAQILARKQAMSKVVTNRLIDDFVSQEANGPKKENIIKSNEKLVEFAKIFFGEWEHYNTRLVDTNHDLYSKQLNQIEYTYRDVLAFSRYLVVYRETDQFDLKAGVFLSALVNSGKGAKYTLDLASLNIPLSYIGHKNTKKVRIFGDVGENAGNLAKSGILHFYGNVGDNCGFFQRGGSIIVDGNAGSNAGGNMDKGRLIINGNAENTVGNWMSGGTIILRGDAGIELGRRISGGTIYVNGKIGSLSDDYYWSGGNIFHKGKQIVKDGKKV
jgi:hypothetical protein